MLSVQEIPSVSATVMTTTEANGSGAGADQDKITTVTDLKIAKSMIEKD